MNPAILQSPFVQTALPIVFTILVAVRANNRAFDGISRRVDDLRDGLRAEMSGLCAEMHDLRVEMNTRFGEVNTRLDRIENGSADPLFYRLIYFGVCR